MRQNGNRKNLRRIILREIQKSFGRFFAIFAIIAIGVGFFSGVRITTPAMVHTVDDFYKENHFFDYQLVSTLGWEDEDVEKVKAKDGVKAAEGVFEYDILALGDEGMDTVFRAHSLTEDINGILVREGRLPEKDDEVLLDSLNRMNFEIGDKIVLSNANEKEDLEHFKNKEYTITGFGDSSLYINFERGTTSLGNGMVTAYFYLTKEGFDEDVYTGMYVDLEGDEEIFSNAYKDKLDAQRDEWEDYVEKLGVERYNRLYDEASEELDDAKEEFNEEKTDGQKELDDAKEDLADAEVELDDAKKDIRKGEREIRDAETDLKDAEQELADAKADLDKGREALLVSEDQLRGFLAQLEMAAAQISEGEANLNMLQGQIEMLSQNPMPSPEEQAMLAMLQEQYTQGAARLEVARAQYSAGVAGYNEGLAAYSKGKMEYEDGLKKYEDGKKKYEDGLKDYKNGKKELVDGKKEYEDGLKEYEDGKKEYEDGLKEFNEKVADAEKEIQDAEDELEDLEEPDTFLIERNTNIGYTCFESDSEIVKQIAKVFPVFFILVASLVCMTTMTRMVEEQRGQIGTLKALGYSEADIMGNFAFYAGSAALLGCVIGHVVGIIIFPYFIWVAYQMMYIVLPLEFIFDPTLAILSILASLICSIGTAYAACRYELQETAANLMRPKAPKPGKRVFLEYITFIWSRLSFSHKVSVRNIFRYKRRLLMMVIGISGSVALLLTGFGMKDSVAGFAEVQYDEIQIADGEVKFKKGSDTDIPGKIKTFFEEENIEYTPLKEATYDLIKGDLVKGVNIIAPYEPEKINDYFKLKTMAGEDIKMPEKGEALISIAISRRYDIKEGDTITLRDEDMNELHLKVTGIFENHVYNYVIMSPDEIDVKLNAAYIEVPEDKDIYKVQAEISKLKNVTYVVVHADFKERISNMMTSLDYIVLLVIISAGGLSFVVLYNLTNINITERVREIATIKVLGFYPNETAAYVFRENLFLTLLGTIGGLILGVALHSFVMSQIKVDMVFFKVSIDTSSYIYSIILAFAFTFLVNFVLRGKLEKISMTESLKSVE